MTEPRPSFKYAFEHALIACCSYIGLTAATNVSSAASNIPDSHRFHVYLICRRPRVYVDPESWSADLDSVSLCFLADWGDGDPARAVLTWPNVYGCLPELQTSAPFSEFTIVGEEGELLVEASASLFLSALAAGGSLEDREPIDHNFLDLSVDYVGKALGTAGSPRSALERLRNHETLQQILADSIGTSPHLEAWIVLLAFEEYTTLGAGGLWEGKVAWEQEEGHLDKIHGQQAMDVDVVVSIAEGALIRYFQPIYNKQLRESFPSPTHRTYKEPYVRDYSALGFQMDSRLIGCRLKSTVIEPSFLHGPVFRMSTDEDRRAFLDFWEDAGSDPSWLLTAFGRDS